MMPDWSEDAEYSKTVDLFSFKKRTCAQLIQSYVALLYFFYSFTYISKKSIFEKVSVVLL